MVITAKEPNDDHHHQMQNSTVDTDEEVVASILCQKHQPVEFMESVMNIIHRKSDDLKSPVFAGSSMRRNIEETSVEMAQEARMNKERLESLSEIVLSKDGRVLDFLDFAMSVVQKNSDLFESEASIGIIMRLVKKYRTAAILKKVKTAIPELMSSLRDIKERVSKMRRIQP